MRYQLYLAEQRKLHAKSDKAKKRKTVQDEIRKVEYKRKLLNKSILAMSLEADKSAAEAEVKHIFTLIAKSTTFRPKIGESEKNEKRFCNQVCVLKKKLEVYGITFILVCLISITMVQYLNCLCSIMTFC